ncbi:putative acetyltransferase [Blastococcus colisei]|uniref:Putative acetyltransferase n=1 Tax=Blastococcus colisei TaxID=1564162 RepID=A0A543P9R8_9ACTN|nr:N-acetyltransferase [Blastococcus colisei]TQN40833.1 putative acetyltransferase [Blastococcus colisei]
MHVRRERPTDHDAVRAVHRAAFARPDTDRTDDVVEARLTDQLRADVGFLPHLSLVAVRDDVVVVGHVLATRGRLEPLGVPALGLGPLGVLPAEQGRGVGTALVHALLAVAETCEERLVALLGAPEYYQRFDFRPATELGITAPDPAWGVHFQARHLTGPPVQGAFRYAAPFDGP